MTAEERARLLELLRNSRDEFLRLVNSLAPELWTARPPGGGWSAQEAAEHLVIGERAMMRRIADALAAAADPNWEAEGERKSRFLEKVLPDRSRKAAAPDFLHPRHNWSREEAVAHYEEGRQRTIAFVEELTGAVKDRIAPHPFPIFGTLNVHHWLLYIPLHNQRHNQQIAETLAVLR